MNKSINPNKAAKQHIELEDFMPGFTMKGKTIETEMEKLVSEIKNCTSCPLAQTRTNTVPGVGNQAARVVFVGEAPGADEDAQGKPFVGRAGKLLNDIIKAMGLKREDVYICNILKCRPPGNRDPQDNEIMKCLPFLKEQLNLIRPKIIVALGAHAARTLLKTNKAIGQLRGNFHDFYFDTNQPPIKLMPTYHPAYLLRNYNKESRKKVWDDIQKVMKELDK